MTDRAATTFVVRRVAATTSTGRRLGAGGMGGREGARRRGEGSTMVDSAVEEEGTGVREGAVRRGVGLTEGSEVGEVADTAEDAVRRAEDLMRTSAEGAVCRAVGLMATSVAGAAEGEVEGVRGMTAGRRMTGVEAVDVTTSAMEVGAVVDVAGTGEEGVGGTGGMRKSGEDAVREVGTGGDGADIVGGVMTATNIDLFAVFAWRMLCACS